jgi:hypothetical protein
MGTGFLIVFGLQAVLRYVHELGTAQAGSATRIGLVAGALLLAAGILGALQILTQARREATAYGVT